MQNVGLILFICLCMGCTTFKIEPNYILKPYEILLIGATYGVSENLMEI